MPARVANRAFRCRCLDYGDVLAAAHNGPAFIRTAAVNSGRLSEDDINDLWDEAPLPPVRAALAHCHSLSPDRLDEAVDDDSMVVRRAALTSRRLDTAQKRRIAQTGDDSVARLAQRILEEENA